MNRRTFLKRTGTAALVAALLPLVHALPSVATAPVAPAEPEGWDLRAQLKDPDVAETHPKAQAYLELKAMVQRDRAAAA